MQDNSNSHDYQKQIESNAQVRAKLQQTIQGLRKDLKELIDIGAGYDLIGDFNCAISQISNLEKFCGAFQGKAIGIGSPLMGHPVGLADVTQIPTYGNNLPQHYK